MLTGTAPRLTFRVATSGGCGRGCVLLCALQPLSRTSNASAPNHTQGLEFWCKFILSISHSMMPSLPTRLSYGEALPLPHTPAPSPTRGRGAFSLLRTSLRPLVNRAHAKTLNAFDHIG